MTRVDVDRTLQRGLVFVYGFAALGGAAISVWTPPSLHEQIGSTWASVLGLFLLLGGGISFIGTLIPRGRVGDWFGEFIGLPLVTAAVGLYGATAALTIDSERGRTGGVLLFMALVSLLVVRWLRVWDDGKRDAERQRRQAQTLPPTAGHP